jgi:hypothetical protein
LTSLFIGPVPFYRDSQCKLRMHETIHRCTPVGIAALRSLATTVTQADHRIGPIRSRGWSRSTSELEAHAKAPSVERIPCEDTLLSCCTNSVVCRVRSFLPLTSPSRLSSPRTSTSTSSRCVLDCHPVAHLSHSTSAHECEHRYACAACSCHTALAPAGERNVIDAQTKVHGEMSGRAAACATGMTGASPSRAL